MILFFFFFSLSCGWSFFGYGNSCKFTREDAITCFRNYVDLDHNGEISVEELETARAKYETTAMKSAEYFLTSRIGRYLLGDINITTPKVIQDCDYNHDGKFTPEDFRMATKTCLPNRYGMCLLHKVCLVAAADNRKPTVARVYSKT